MMFGIGFTELIVIAVIALVVLGPDRLPEMARVVGKAMRDLRETGREMRDEFSSGLTGEDEPRDSRRSDSEGPGES